MTANTKPLKTGVTASEQKPRAEPRSDITQARGAARRARTREKLIAAAARVVAEAGEKNAKIDDFIVAAGVARGTFYNYYSTREELLEDLWQRVGQNPFHEILQASAAIEDPAERLAAETQMVLLRATEDPVWGWVVYAFSGAVRVPQEMLNYPKPDLIFGQRLGRFHFDNLESATDLVVGSARAALHTALHHGVDLNYARSITTLLLIALGIRDREAQAIVRKPLPLPPKNATESKKAARTSKRP